MTLGTVRVGDEVKNTLVLRNRGRQEIDFRFEIEPRARPFFAVTPPKGHLPANERPHNVSVVFCAASQAVALRETPFLKCNLFESEKGGGANGNVAAVGGKAARIRNNSTMEMSKTSISMLQFLVIAWVSNLAKND